MRRSLHALVALVLLAALAACGSEGDDAATTTSEPTTTAADDATSTTPDDDGGADLAETPVLLYFVRGEAVAVGGFAAVGPTVGRQAMEALLAGPTGENAAAGMGSQIPPDTELLGLDVADGTATVDLSDEFTSGGGSLAMQLRVAQVVYTLVQFPTVDRVDIQIEGEVPEGIGGEGLPTSYDDPATAFADVTPAILITSPVPGEVVSMPLTVEGTSTTFEATIQWSLGTTVGKIIDEGFATDGGANGTYDAFEITMEGDGSTGSSVVTLWQDSAESGDRVDVYEVPVTIG
ncbi:MAG: GerMN domain-containing protein [Acidimicrobiales bacterium]|nr:GerMN domain-containing protein [Acidimicrobiales bacterium]